MNQIEPPLTADAAAAPAVSELLVSGMNCNNCARHVAEALESVPGVRSVLVRLEAGRASVRWTTPAAANPSAIVAAVKAAGYEARPVENAPREPARRRQAGWHLNLWLGVLVTAPLMAGEWIFDLGLTPWFQWLSFLLAGLVQTVAGAQFYRGAWRQLQLGRSNMDTLVALGSSTAFGYSAWALFSRHGGHLYFMEAAAIITLISVGHWIEARVSARASSALAALLNLAPPKARRRLPDGAETEVLVAALSAGDLVVLKPGDRIPTDGIVIEGDSAVDESMLTGEAVPADKSPTAQVYVGTVNLNGRLLMRVTATGEATALAQVIAAVQRAQTSRANIQRLGDRVSSVFVPIVVVVAIVAGLGWGLWPELAKQLHSWFAQFLWAGHVAAGETATAFIVAAAVLIVACPCAMGLATPAAIMASTNAAARRGILIRDGVALEKAGRVTSVLFDKTGTLTLGELGLVGPWVSGNSEDETHRVRELAATLARHSNHPISKVVARLSDADVRVTGWREVAGSGVQGIWHNARGEAKTVRLGSLVWLRESGVELDRGREFIEQHSACGDTVIGVAEDQSLTGLFAVRDTLKPGAAQVIRQLQQRGLRVFLLTGDNPRAAAALARQVHIAPENVFAEVRPEEKAERVRQLQQRGERVAFVGDGINDAPALEQADLGIAVSRASDVAREAADLILLRSEIEAVPEALGLARATLRTIKQNLFWAFFYNAVGVPLAALGFMSPVLCAAAMGASDLFVIGNALRLLRWRLSERAAV